MSTSPPAGRRGGSPRPGGPQRPRGGQLEVLLALSSPLLILLALVALLQRPGSERVQALPALLIGSGLLTTSWIRRRRRRREILRAVRQELRPPDPP